MIERFIAARAGRNMSVTDDAERERRNRFADLSGLASLTPPDLLARRQLCSYSKKRYSSTYPDCAADGTCRSPDHFSDSVDAIGRQTTVLARLTGGDGDLR